MAFNSCGSLGREVKGKSLLPGNPGAKAIAVGNPFALTAYQFFSLLWYKQGRL